jgi:hypothetical protein
MYTPPFVSTVDDFTIAAELLSVRLKSRVIVKTTLLIFLKIMKKDFMIFDGIVFLGGGESRRGKYENSRFMVAVLLGHEEFNWTQQSRQTLNHTLHLGNDTMKKLRTVGVQLNSSCTDRQYYHRLSKNIRKRKPVVSNEFITTDLNRILLKRRESGEKMKTFKLF